MKALTLVGGSVTEQLVVSPQPSGSIGTLVELSSFTAAAIRNNLVAVGTTISSVGNELRINGTGVGQPTPTTNTTNLPIDHSSEKWRFTIRFRPNVTTGTQRLGIGIRSTHFRNLTGTNKSVSATFDFASDSANRGQLIFFTGANNQFTQRAIATAITCNAGNIIEIVLEKNGAQFTATATNLSDSSTQTINYTYPLQATTDPVIANTGRPALYTLHQANIEVTYLKFEELTPAFPFLLVLGDSKSVGYNTTANADRYITQLQTQYPGRVEAWAGFGDELGDAMTWMSLVRRLQPENVLIALGSNDRRNNVTDVILTQNLERLRDAFQLIGSKCWFLGMSENTVNQAVLFHRAKGIFSPSRCIFTEPALAADGVHLTTAGHNTVRSAIQSSIFN